MGATRAQGDRIFVRRAAGPAGESREESFAETDVLSSVPQSEVRKSCEDLLRTTPRSDGRRCLLIGKLAAEALCLDEMTQAVDAALASGEDVAKARAILRPVAEQHAAGVPAATVRARTRQLLESAASTGSRCKQELAKLTAAALPKADMLPALETALVANEPGTRRAAADVLAAVAPKEKSDALVRRVMHDPDESVRTAAATAIAAGKDPRAFGSLLKGVDSSFATTRIHSAEALGTIGAREAMPVLVNRLAALMQGGGGTTAPRAYFSATNQQAYVSDYNVEVAQASAIAEPVIGVLQDGVVLDVRVLNVSRQVTLTQEVRAVRGALGRIAGRDLGDDPVAWATWYNSAVARTAAEGPKTPG